MQKFIVGAKYNTASICDSNCIFSMVVVSRTEKTAMVSQRGEKPRRYKIHAAWNGLEESIRMGNYSMASSWGASDIVSPVVEEALVTDEEIAETFSTAELELIGRIFREELGAMAQELPPNCVPFRRKVA